MLVDCKCKNHSLIHRYLFRVTLMNGDGEKYKDEGHIKPSEEVQQRQILDFSPPSNFPLLRGEDSGAGLLTRRAEYGVGGWMTPKKPEAKRWEAYFSHGNNNLDTTNTWSQSQEVDENLYGHKTRSPGVPDEENSMEHWQFGPPEEEEGTWVLVHDDYWDRRDRLRRNASPSEEISSSADARRHDRSANPESWTVWHGGPKQDGSGKFVSAQLEWDATQVPRPKLGALPPNQAYSERRPPKPQAPRVVRNPKEPRGRPRGKARKARRPPKQDLLSFLKSLNPLAPKAQQKQGHAFQLEAQGAIRNAMDTMMSTIRSGDERQALFREMMTPRR